MTLRTKKRLNRNARQRQLRRGGKPETEIKSVDATVAAAVAHALETERKDKP